MTERYVPTAEAGYAALREHVRERARAARAKHGVPADLTALQALLSDPEVVRFPTSLAFDAGPLRPGEFGWAQPLGERPGDGYRLVLHPVFAARGADALLLALYLLVSINYLDVATGEEALLYGGAFLELDVEEYYQRVLALAEEVPGVTAGQPCSGGCACGTPSARSCP
jgi:hypothetical protein